MRLSTAIMLGRHLVEPKAGDLSGCALGMGLASCGESFDYATLNIKWSWLERKPLSLPCSCGGYANSSSMTLAIAHIFDSHVMCQIPDENENYWTLERLVDWIRSIEPAESQEFSEAVEVLAGEVVSK